MTEAHEDWQELKRLFPSVRAYQELASRHGINDVFQDNGGKLLQVLLITGLKAIPGRAGHDAVDGDGKEYELKSVNTNLTRSFSTHHHMTLDIVKSYREVAWVFAVYEGIELVEIIRVSVEDMEPYFSDWEEKIRERLKTHALGAHLNNPKIKLSFVRSVGEVLYSADREGPVDTENLF